MRPFGPLSRSHPGGPKKLECHARSDHPDEISTGIDENTAYTEDTVDGTEASSVGDLRPVAAEEETVVDLNPIPVERCRVSGISIPSEEETVEDLNPAEPVERWRVSAISIPSEERCTEEPDSAKHPARVSVATSRTSILDAVRRGSSRSFVREASPSPSRHIAANITELLERDPAQVSVLLAEAGLLRGVSFAVLAGGLGRIFRIPSAGIAGGANNESYSKSEAMLPGDKFQAFISHSWKASAFFKALTLLSRQFFRPFPLMILTLAVLLVASCCTAVLLAVSIQRGCTSSWPGTCYEEEPNDSDGNQRHTVVVGAVQLVGITVVLLFVFGALILGPHWLVPRSNRYFLDKCSINQDQQELKQMGVGHLCEFVQASDEMIVLADRTYLNRLWCVCELALFARINPDLKNLDWRFLWAAPAAQTLSLLGAVLWYALVIPRLCDVSGRARLVSELTLEFCGGLVFIAAAFFLCWWVRTSRQCLRDLETFSIRSAECFFLDDRVLICDFVAAAWTVLEQACEADEEEGVGPGLDAFDEFVRGKMRDAVARRNFSMLPAFRALFGPMVMLHTWLAIAGVLPELLASRLSTL